MLKLYENHDPHPMLNLKFDHGYDFVLFSLSIIIHDLFKFTTNHLFQYSVMEYMKLTQLVSTIKTYSGNKDCMTSENKYAKILIHYHYHNQN